MCEITIENAGQKIMVAKALATIYHGDQKYGDLPYACHLEAVRREVTELLNSSSHGEVCRLFVRKAIILAIIHDTGEDTELAESTILEEFGNEIAVAWKAITKHQDESYNDYMLRVMGNDLALVTKFADSTCNFRSSVSTGRMSGILKYGNNLKMMSETVSYAIRRHVVKK